MRFPSAVKSTNTSPCISDKKVHSFRLRVRQKSFGGQRHRRTIFLAHREAETVHFCHLHGDAFVTVPVTKSFSFQYFSLFSSYIRVKLRLALRLNQTPRFENWLIPRLLKIVSNQTPVAPTSLRWWWPLCIVGGRAQVPVCQSVIKARGRRRRMQSECEQSQQPSVGDA